jgi:hypothetical protein
MDVEPMGAEFEEGWPAATARLCHSKPGRPEHDNRIHSGIPAARNTEACHPGSNGARCRPLDWKAGGVLVVLAYEVNGTCKGRRRADVRITTGQCA